MRPECLACRHQDTEFVSKCSLVNISRHHNAYITTFSPYVTQPYLVLRFVRSSWLETRVSALLHSSASSLCGHGHALCNGVIGYAP